MGFPSLFGGFLTAASKGADQILNNINAANILKEKAAKDAQAAAAENKKNTGGLYNPDYTTPTTASDASPAEPASAGSGSSTPGVTPATPLTDKPGGGGVATPLKQPTGPVLSAGGALKPQTGPGYTLGARPIPGTGAAPVSPTTNWWSTITSWLNGDYTGEGTPASAFATPRQPSPSTMEVPEGPTAATPPSLGARVNDYWHGLGGGQLTDPLVRAWNSRFGPPTTPTGPVAPPGTAPQSGSVTVPLPYASASGGVLGTVPTSTLRGRLSISRGGQVQPELPPIGSAYLYPPQGGVATVPPEGALPINPAAPAMVTGPGAGYGQPGYSGPQGPQSYNVDPFTGRPINPLAPQVVAQPAVNGPPQWAIDQALQARRALQLPGLQ